MRPVALLLALGLTPLSGEAMARDYGQQGAVFPLLEPDLLSTIATRLHTLQANGGIDRMNRELAERTERKVRRPDPVPGVSLAVRPRSWTYDPSIAIDHDVFDTKGNAIARKGQRINPLDFVSVHQALVFIDGDDPAQMHWAMTHYSDLTAKIVLVAGAPLEAMTRYQRRFYFDQGGFLVDRFGIRAVPAVVEQAGKVMRVSEIPVSLQRGS